MEDNIVLTMRGICMTFPGVKALDNVDFTLRKGEIHALMGENGAGKSTLIKCLTGINDFEAGEIRVNGIEGPVKNHSTLDAQKVGISTVYQEVNLCPNLSVAENLYIGREPMTPFHTIDRRTMNKKADELCKRLDIKVDVTQNLENYSLALQQMIAIARAVDMDCKALILDEPTSSLDDSEVEKLFKMMLQLKEQGVGIVFVTHFLEQVYAVCDRITVLRNGTLVGEYPVAELPRVKLVAAMMGKDFDDLASIKPEGFTYDKEAPLEISARGLSHKGTIKPFDLDIHKGEVIGLTGLLGSGRSELARSIYGADKAQTGTLKVKGKEVKINQPIDAMNLGMGLLPDDRKAEGIIGDLSVRENIILALQAKRGTFNQLSDRQPGDPHQAALRRQPAEGHPGPVAGHRPQLPDPGRAHPGHRHRDQDRNSKADYPAGRRGKEHHVHLLRDRGDAPDLQPDGGPPGRRQGGRAGRRADPGAGHGRHCGRCE